MIKSRTMRWVGHVVCMGEMRNIYTTFWLERLKGRDHLEDVSTDERIILKWFIGK
jgi:hypothetical protein